MDNDFYVYEHIRNDNNTVFYVWKGRGKRAYYSKRNPHHDNIAVKHGFTVRIVNDNISEEEAFKLEQEIIHKYVFETGYGIDIIGLRKPNSDRQLTNCTLGGDGNNGAIHSKEWCEQHSKDMTGDQNPMYGINVFETYSPEKLQNVKKKMSIANSGKNNSMYGISPKDRMNEETYQIWLEKRIEYGKQHRGKNNPNYGNHILHEYYQNHPEEKQKLARNGSQNGRCVPVDLYNINGEFIKHFDYIGECAEYIKHEKNIATSVNNMCINIRKCIKQNKPYRSYYIKKTI